MPFYLDTYWLKRLLQYITQAEKNQLKCVKPTKQHGRTFYQRRRPSQQQQQRIALVFSFSKKNK